MSARFALERRAFRDTLGRSVNDRLDQPDLGNQDKRILKHNPLRDAESWRVGLLGFEFREALLLFAVARPTKEMLIGALQVTKRLLQRLAVDLLQPGGCGLLFDLGEFGRKVVVGKRRAGLLVVFAFLECK